MKNPSSFLHARSLIAIQLTLGLGANAALIDHDTSAIHESYDRNPIGPMVGKPTGGYGVWGTYAFQGPSAAVADAAFQVVEGGLPFSSYNSTAGRCVSVSAGEATGVGIQVDGGKAWGDVDFYQYDKLYCSYLINFSEASNTASSRAMVRTSTASYGGDQFLVEADGAAALENGASTSTPNTLLQPLLAYRNTSNDRVQNAVSNVLKLKKTYMLIGRFDNAGNALSSTPTGTWTSGSSTIEVSAIANLQVGQLVTGAGIASNSIVRGITPIPDTSRANVTLSLPTIANGSATALNFLYIRNERSAAVAKWVPPATGVTTTEITLIDAPSYPIKVGMIVTGTGIPANSAITDINTTSGTKITLNTAVTATVESGLLTFHSVTPLTGTWSSGSQTITLNLEPQNSAIKIGDTVSGAGIPAQTFVQSKSGNTITLTKATTAAGLAGTAVYINERTAKSSLFALTEAQYEHMISLGSQEAKEAFLDTAPMGDTVGNPAQVAIRIVGIPISAGSIEFGQGRYVHIIGAGSSSSLQKYKMDEVRYGFTLKSVTQPSTMPSVPAGDPAAFDDATRRAWHGWDNGYGWKSGYYIVEETAATQGAYLWNTPAFEGYGELAPGSGDYILIEPREATSTDQGTRRRPDPAVVDMTKPYTASFDFQLKSSYRTFTAFEDRIQFGADGQVAASGAKVVGTNLGPNPGRPNVPTAGGTNISWMAGVVGNNPNPTRNFVPGRWFFYNYTGAHLNNNYFVGENTVLASDDNGTDPAPNTDKIPPLNAGDDDAGGGGIFSFKFEVNPQTYTYRGTITYRATKDAPSHQIRTYSKGGLKFRDNADAETLFWGISKNTNELRMFALDNIRVSQGVDFFPDWVGTYAAITSAGNQTRSADPDGDGRKNFLEYALDGDPSSPAGTGKEIHGVTTISSNQYHTLTVPIRSGFSFSPANSPNTGDLESNHTNNEGIRYRIEGSYDLVNWNATVVEVSPALANTPSLSASPGYEYKSFRLGQPISASQPKGFLRVVVDSTK
jgi:hypothetical protein